MEMMRECLLRELEALHESFCKDFRHHSARPGAPIDEYLAELKHIACSLLLKIFVKDLRARLSRLSSRRGLSTESIETINALMLNLDSMGQSLAVDLSKVLVEADFRTQSQAVRSRETDTRSLEQKVAAIRRCFGNASHHGINEAIFPWRYQIPIDDEAALARLPLSADERLIVYPIDGQSALMTWGELLVRCQPYRDLFWHDTSIFPPHLEWYVSLSHGGSGVFAKRDCSIQSFEIKVP